MRHYEFIIPGEFPTLNQVIDKARANKFAAAAQKKKYDHLVIWEAHRQLKGIKINRKSSFVIRWYRANRQTDPDNLTIGTKFILDGLQKAGVLQNDNWKITSGGFLYQFGIDKLKPRVEVHIFEGMDLELDLNLIIKKIENLQHEKV